MRRVSSRMGKARAIRTVLLASALAGLSAHLLATRGGAAAMPAIEIRGLRIVGPGLSEDKLRPFNGSQGTTVAILVRTPGGTIIALDGDRSAIEAYRDDKGTDLLKAKGSGLFASETRHESVEISEDGKACLIEITSPGLPTKGARALRLKGTLSLKVAEGQKVARQEKVEAKEGSAIEAGPIPLAIKKVGEPDWGGDEAKMAIELEAKEDVTEIAKLRFFDAKGKEIASRRAGTSSSSFGDLTNVTWTYHLNEKVTSFAIEVTYWTSVREIRVPYALDVGVGL